MYRASKLTFIQGLPTFHFDSLTHPSFFLQSVLAHRLALIKSIRVCYNQTLVKQSCTAITRRKRRSVHDHVLQQCPQCNVKHWLNTIRDTMHGLERIDALIYADVEMTGTINFELWIGSLFDLQHGANGLRDLQIRVYPIKASYVAAGSYLFTQSHEATAQTEQIDQLLQERIKKGVEAFHKKGAGLPLKDKQTSDASC